MKSTEIILKKGDTIYPFSIELRDYSRENDYRIETIIDDDSKSIIIHGINKKIATEEALLNGINEFIFAPSDDEIERVKL